MSVEATLIDKPLKCRRRKIGSTRFDVNVDVEFVSANPEGTGIEGIGVVRNLSIRGALIETNAALMTNDKLTLYLTLPNGSDLLEIRTVTVRWIRGRQLGVEFLKLDPDTARHLMKYLSGIHTARRVQDDTADTK